jgi:LPS O-antigen subunit length determinant protein (WzzB/FepE family)
MNKRRTNEMDLIQLAVLLWKKKMILISSMLIFFFYSLYIISEKKAEYSVSASYQVVMETKFQELNKYLLTNELLDYFKNKFNLKVHIKQNKFYFISKDLSKKNEYIDLFDGYNDLITDQALVREKLEIDFLLKENTALENINLFKNDSFTQAYLNSKRNVELINSGMKILQIENITVKKIKIKKILIISISLLIGLIIGVFVIIFKSIILNTISKQFNRTNHSKNLD